jgi:NADH-quinone oxidoreductase subunit I
MIKPFLIGFATTLRHMFKKPVSVNYPDQKVPMYPKWRGKQVLMRDENGLEKCVACGLARGYRPTRLSQAEENDGSVAAGPRYAKVYHKTRCISAATAKGVLGVGDLHGQGPRAAVYGNKDFIWDLQDSLVPAPGGVVPAAVCAECAPSARATDFSTRDVRVLISTAMGTIYRRASSQPILHDELNLTRRIHRRDPSGLCGPGAESRNQHLAPTG